VKDYLESLEYDGGKHVDLLLTYFTDKDNVFVFLLRRYLVGAVARVYEQTQNAMLVLDGEQDLGKSAFARWLTSGLEHPGHFIESNIDTENKDHTIRLATTWIWEVGELGSTTSRADRSKLKAFLTRETICERKSYGRLPISKPAITSFIGTINNDIGFLNDPTGNRRYNPTTLTSINWDYSKNIDVNQVWAEAVDLYKNGEPWRLKDTEKQKNRIY